MVQNNHPISTHVAPCYLETHLDASLKKLCEVTKRFKSLNSALHEDPASRRCCLQSWLTTCMLISKDKFFQGEMLCDKKCGRQVFFNRFWNCFYIHLNLVCTWNKLTFSTNPQIYSLISENGTYIMLHGPVDFFVFHPPFIACSFLHAFPNRCFLKG